MSKTIIKVENLSKKYRLGVVGSKTLQADISYWWAKLRGKANPNVMISDDQSNIKNNDNVWALKDMNFEVKEGEILGIIGKNGAGKSTLLKILSKITAPTTGNVKVKGRIGSLLEVGTGFHKELTGRENIFLNGTILGMRKHEIKARLDEIIDFSGVEKYIDTPVKRYSSGMYVRLGFAVAAHLDTDILLVDEVLSVGDVDFQKKSLGKMNEAASGGKTVIFVSHNMISVKSLCTRGVLIKNGQIAQEESVNKIISLYLGSGQNIQNYRRFEQNYGLEYFKLIFVGVKALEKDFTEPISREEEIEIVIEYFYQKKIANRLDFTLQFKSEEGSFLFINSTLLDGKVKIKEGMNTLKVLIPPNFFNQGIFYVNLLLVKDKRTSLLIEEDIIKIMINPEKRDLGAWTGKTKGFFTPNFTWI